MFKNIEHAQNNLNTVKIFFEQADGTGTRFIWQIPRRFGKKYLFHIMWVGTSYIPLVFKFHLIATMAIFGKIMKSGWSVQEDDVLLVLPIFGILSLTGVCSEVSKILLGLRGVGGSLSYSFWHFGLSGWRINRFQISKGYKLY